MLHYSFPAGRQQLQPLLDPPCCTIPSQLAVNNFSPCSTPLAALFLPCWPSTTSVPAQPPLLYYSFPADRQQLQPLLDPPCCTIPSQLAVNNFIPCSTPLAALFLPCWPSTTSVPARPPLLHYSFPAGRQQLQSLLDHPCCTIPFLLAVVNIFSPCSTPLLHYSFPAGRQQ